MEAACATCAGPLRVFVSGSREPHGLFCRACFEQQERKISSGTDISCMSTLPDKHGRLSCSWHEFNVGMLRVNIVLKDVIFSLDGWPPPLMEGEVLERAGDYAYVLWGKRISRVDHQMKKAVEPFLSRAGNKESDDHNLQLYWTAMTERGDVFFWASDGKRCFEKVSNCLKVSQTKCGGTAVLKRDKSVFLLGASTVGGIGMIHTLPINDVVSSECSTFEGSEGYQMVLYENNRVGLWGGNGSLEITQAQEKLESTEFKSIVGMTGRAFCGFAAIDTNGGVVVIGDSFKDATATVESKISSGVYRVIAHHGSFIALKTDGSVVFWTIRPGIDFSRVEYSLSRGVKDVVTCGFSSFAALKRDGTVVSWGGDGPNESFPDLNAVSMIGYDSPLHHMSSSKYIVLTKDGRIYESGGEILEYSDYTRRVDVIHIAELEGRCFMIKKIYDGKKVTLETAEITDDRSGFLSDPGLNKRLEVLKTVKLNKQSNLALAFVNRERSGRL
jgi:hypothetical protein